MPTPPHPHTHHPHPHPQAELNKAIGGVQTHIRADKYRSRTDGNDIWDVNRKQAGIVNQADVKRTVLSEALRAKEVLLVISH